MKKFFRVLACFLALLAIGKLQAQKVQIETTNLEILNNKLAIHYNFIKSKKNQLFTVWIEVTTASGKTLNASSVSGDIGNDIEGGENKSITWDYNKDGVVLNEEVAVEVMATITESKGSIPPILLSALVPGLGLSKMNKGKPYWLLGVASYGSLAASYFMHQSAVTRYDEYKGEVTDVETSDELYKKTESQLGTSRILGYSAAGIWAVSMVWTLIKNGNKGNSTANLYKKKKIVFFSGINPITKTTEFKLRYRF